MHNVESDAAMDTSSRNTSFSSLYAAYRNRLAKSKPIQVTHPEMRRSTSAEHNAAMRQTIASWGSTSSTPPGCRAVSDSSWRRFSATSSNRSKSRDEMTAAALLGTTGLAPEFDPPILERCNLSIPEDAACGNPAAEHAALAELPYFPKQRYNSHSRMRRTHSSRTSSTGSCSTLASEERYASGATRPIIFAKQMVRPASTSSLLTLSFKESPKSSRSAEPPKVALDKIGKEFGIEELRIEDLPENAFESDSEDED